MLLLSIRMVYAEEPATSSGSAPETTPEAAPPPPALTPEELAAIEAALASDTAAVEPVRSGGGGLQSMNPDLAFIADVAFAYFSAEEPLMAGGHDPNQSGFSLQQLELSVSKPVDPYFRFDSNIVFSLFGVEIEEVYATTLALPGRLQLRTGQFLTRFGRSNATHPHAWDFVEQNMAVGRVFGGEGNRGLGVELSWLTPLPWYVEVVGSGTGAAGESTARSFYGAEDLGFRSPADLQATLAIKQFFSLSSDVSLFWGLSGAFGPNPTGLGNRSEVYGTDLYLKYRPISRDDNVVVAVQAEAFYRRRQVVGDVLADWTGYGQLSWKFSQRWGTSGRYELGTPARGLSGEVVGDPLDPEWDELRQRGALAVTFWPTEFSRLRAEGLVDTGYENKLDYAGFLAFEFNVGAHGAHAF